MVDVDHFKLFNDSFGHLTGDECLRAVAQALSVAVRRPNDLAARYGGEEFALILPHTDAAGAVLIGERVRAELRQANLRHEGSPSGRVTVSIGAASMLPGSRPNSEILVAEADTALYAAKAAGRDTIVSATRGLVAH
jgi:diguanylate cyclase (GGDEF)-like protein